MASAPAVLAEVDSPAAGPVTELFTTRPMQSPRPWPRAIMPGLPAQDAIPVCSGGTAQEKHPIHPFAPPLEPQPAQPEPPPDATTSEARRAGGRGSRKNRTRGAAE